MVPLFKMDGVDEVCIAQTGSKIAGTVEAGFHISRDSSHSGLEHSLHEARQKLLALPGFGNQILSSGRRVPKAVLYLLLCLRRLLRFD